MLHDVVRTRGVTLETLRALGYRSERYGHRRAEKRDDEQMTTPVHRPRAAEPLAAR